MEAQKENTTPNHKAAVILAGAGVYDGSEILESSSIIFALHEFNYEVTFFAPDCDQMHVVDHIAGAPMEGETRNVLKESARICRGQISPLSELKADNFDVVLMPGGFGVGKNLSDYSVKGAEMTVIPELEQVLKAFHEQKKVIAACCIAPVIIAKVIPGVKLTLGCKGDQWPYNGTIDVAEGFGANHVEADEDEVVVDEENRVVTAPAFMKSQRNYFTIYQNVRSMVVAVNALL